MTTVQPVFLSQLVEQLTGFEQVFDKLKEKSIKMMERYDPVESLARLIENLENSREFARSGGKTISDEIMVSKCITLLTQMSTFNKDIRQYRQQTLNLKTCLTFNLFSHQSHHEQIRAVTTTGNGVIINKIEISNPKSSLITCIGTPPNSPSKNTLEISDSGANIHQAKHGTNIMAIVIISNNMISCLIYGIPMDSSHIATL